MDNICSNLYDVEPCFVHIYFIHLLASTTTVEDMFLRTLDDLIKKRYVCDGEIRRITGSSAMF